MQKMELEIFSSKLRTQRLSLIIIVIIGTFGCPSYFSQTELLGLFILISNTLIRQPNECENPE
jgi:hypothetical protein